MKERIFEILSDIKNLKNKNESECRLPENTFYLNDSDILCLERENGEARYPYETDGLNLWAHSNGHINACESNMVILRTASVAEEPSVDFWLRVNDNGRVVPISVTGATKHMFEPDDVSRYCVYSKSAAYYILETSECVAALRANLGSDKKIYFTLSVINTAESEKDVSVVSYIDPMIRFTNNEDPWVLLRRYGWYNQRGSFKIKRYPNPENQDVINVTNIAVINRAVKSENPCNITSTAAKSVFIGEKGRTLFNASALKNGVFPKEVYAANTTDFPIASDIIKFNLLAGEEATAVYSLMVVHDDDAATKASEEKINFESIENDLLTREKEEDRKLGGMKLGFGEIKDFPVNYNVFNKFLKNVQKQVTFCALGKNYAGDLLGVRDVFQQLTAALMWDAKDAREKIVLALNFIMENGRAPRQFSVPPKDDVIPTFDIRQFIDQGLWIVETLHKYVSWTKDLSILDEKCSYYKIIDEKKSKYEKSKCVDTVLEHLLKIIDYLISNIDERTGCLKILYGDWNDAICGLGESLDGKSEFGSGVSVMATLQLYKALKEMTEILELTGKGKENCERYAKIRENMVEGLNTYAKQKDGDRTHLIHGWGDEGKYLVGSLCDSDDNLRYSVNPYSFWCISDMIQREPALKNDILKAYDVLDSKYGIKTLTPYFARDMKGVGRIVELTPGTYENSCAYIHATMFAVMALFELGEGKRAWEQIVKAIPISHASVNKTSFVMPNSYCYNEEFYIDGESAGDWYTGSGAVLIRSIIEHAFGIQVSPSGVHIEMPDYMPSNGAEITVNVKGCELNLSYKNTGKGERAYVVNGNDIKTLVNEVSCQKYIYIKNEDLGEKLTIEVLD